MSKEHLAHIRELIRQKQYEAARQQLMSLSEQGNPTAQKWLVKLNEIAPPEPATEDAGISAYLDAVDQKKAERRKIEAETKAQQRRLGCMVRSIIFLIVCFILIFALGPMLLAAGIVSNNPQVNRVTSSILSFIEHQQGNPVERTVTQFYSETSGRVIESLIVANTDQICDLASEQAASQGMTIRRADCEQVVREASVCMTEQLPQAQQCLRNYVTKRCLQQAGNSPQAQAYCANFVKEHMG